MSKFEDFMKSQVREPRKGMEIDGSFGCQTCDLEVEEAEYFNIEKVLKWKCANGHISYIEDFKL